MIVLDASAATDYLLRLRAFDEIAERLVREGETLHVPHLFDAEVLYALRRLAASRSVSPDQAAEALAALLDLRVRRYPHRPLLPRMWELRQNVSTFDSAYIALAEALEAPLVTSDAALARAPGHRARLEVFA